jgi:hypothetical protein
MMAYAYDRVAMTSPRKNKWSGSSKRKRNRKK